MDAHERQEDVPHECIDVGYLGRSCSVLRLIFPLQRGAALDSGPFSPAVGGVHARHAGSLP